MDIGFYIADLLREKDEVNVPGLGTFTKVRIAGSYDSSGSVFSPPSYHLSFDKNDKSTSDHRLLTNFISNQKNLSLSSAEYFIEKFAAQFSELLGSAGFAEIKPLGTIRKENDELHFEPLDTLKIEGNFYGLKPVHDRKTIVNLIPSEPAKQQEILVAEDQDIERTEVSEEIEVSEETEEIEETGKRNGLKLVLAILLPLILAGAALLYYFNPIVHAEIEKFRSGIFPDKKQSPAPAPVTEAIIPAADSTLSTADTLSNVQDTLQLNTDNPPQSSADQVQAAVPDEAITFEIIGAAFASKKEAETYISQLASRDIKAKIVDNMPGRMIKISLGSFNDEVSARVELARIHKELNKEAWIARIKPPKNP